MKLVQLCLSLHVRMIPKATFSSNCYHDSWWRISDCVGGTGTGGEMGKTFSPIILSDAMKIQLNFLFGISMIPYIFFDRAACIDGDDSGKFAFHES